MSCMRESKPVSHLTEQPRSNMSKIILLICAAVLIVPVQKSFSADKAYVIDKLLVGIYEKEDLNSAIVKIIPTGTELEIVQKTDHLALVIDPTGAKGWIDKSYLMAEPTSEIILKKLRKKNTTAPKDTLATLTKNNTQLKIKLADILPKAKKCESKLSILEKESVQMRQKLDTRCSSLDSSATQTEENYTAVKAALEKANMRIQKQNLIKNAKITSELALMVTQRYLIQLAMIILLVAGAAFGAGIYIIDVIYRKRHGGYRL